MNSEPDIAQLRATFLGYDCQGVVALIDFLASARAEGLLEIGSSTLDLRGAVTNAKTDDEKAEAIFFKTQEFHLGSRDGSTTPLQSIAQMAEGFEDFPLEGRNLFDQICGGFAAMATAIPVGPVERYTQEGHRTIQPEDYVAEQKEIIRKKIN